MVNYKYNNLEELNLLFPNFPPKKVDMEMVNFLFEKFKANKPIFINEAETLVGMLKYLLNGVTRASAEEEGINVISCYIKLYDIYCYVYKN